MSHNWNHERATAHISKKLKEVSAVEILDYKRDTSLENIPVNRAYRVMAAHLYADILNLDEMLNVTDVEGVTCHRRTLRFLNLHYRAAARILAQSDIRRVDFHNQRLHGLVAKPYGDEQEATRVHRAVATAQLLIDVLAETGDDDEQIPNALVRVGIDTGEALAVNNGRRGGREPLFLGEPANMAAKFAAGGTKGIFLTAAARAAIGLKAVSDPKSTALTTADVAASQEAAQLSCDKDQIVRQWRDDLAANPIGAFEFSGHTPPLSGLDISALTPKNSRRQDALSLYADLDGFTAFVNRHVADRPGDVIKTLHVIRAEMDRVLTTDFGGRKVRFIGDCAHGLLCEGTAQTTDAAETVSTGILCAGALRSSFELSLEALEEADIDIEGLGLQIGMDYGPVTITRLGLHGDRVRCSVSRAVRSSEAEQLRCGAEETALGQEAFDNGRQAVRDLFGDTRKVANLDYNEAVEGLAEREDATASAAKAAAFSVAAPAVARSTRVEVKPYAQAK
ncbi:transcriptional regulator [Phenylobacterium sp. LH3H17]|uniref:adenylate/guanylate cyclase domain-containing protein n=1 Tax=Phenylobacterium sp. LH3H17 TaxID=2903901 RepID=UPI0020C99585|nr:adenylate/guanylate cyclase domain-containing protein [Phenylobacterium sp. LH3H17]UTP40928.1 transcriptional regulator [Phenylobacterium sp. LH3H17]